jgi:hypothetical protein
MKGNKTMKTTTSFTYPAFALFVLACFALSPQAFAVAPPTLSPPSSSNCTNYTNVTICCTDQNAKIHVWGTGMIAGDLPGVPPAHCGTINVYHPGTTTLNAYCDVGGTHSATVTGTYRKVCTKLILVIGGILLAAVLIWLFVKKSSANR